MNRFRPLLLVAFLSSFLAACLPDEVNPNITPTVDLYVTVVDELGNTVSQAQVYLFSFESTYQNYLVENPEGDPNITPLVGADDVGVTNSTGQAIFFNRPLEGNSYASGDTWFHRPNPIYIRVQANLGGVYYTNDRTVNRISFDEIESGERIVEYLEIEVNI
ncbi:MAG: hypothetical protein D6722_19765 [Bacteroidetes bacterium]|nr:MAG: hypothetical protein D6722_19765 [Bacteroidota bacterium]